MEKKMFWGLGFLIVIFTAFMVYMYFDNVKFRDQMNGFKAFRKNLQQTEEVEVEQKEALNEIEGSDDMDDIQWPETTPTEPVVEKTTEGYRVYSFDEFNQLPGDERDEAYRQWREDYKKRMGVEAAPLGEHYNHVKDADGNIYRVYPNTVTFLKPKKMKIGYAPTLEQHKRMLNLHAQWHEAEHEGNTAEVKRLEEEMDKLKQEAQGEIPTLGPGVYVGIAEGASENMDRQIAAAARQAYIDLNLEHIMPK